MSNIGHVIPQAHLTVTKHSGPAAFIPGFALFFLWPKNFRTFTRAQFRQLDYLGIVLVLLGTVLLVFILNQVAVKEYAWNSATTICVLILSGLAWIALFLWQWQLSRNPRFRRIRPQFPFRLDKDRIMLSIFRYALLSISPPPSFVSDSRADTSFRDSSTFLAGFVMFITVVSIPLRAQIVNIYDPVKAAILLLPLMGGTAVGTALGGALSVKKNLTFYSLVAASVFMMVGSGLMSTLPDDLQPPAKQYGYEVLLGLGLGLNFSTSTLMTSLQAKFDDHGK